MPSSNRPLRLLLLAVLALVLAALLWVLFGALHSAVALWRALRDLPSWAQTAALILIAALVLGFVFVAWRVLRPRRRKPVVVEAPKRSEVDARVDALAQQRVDTSALQTELAELAHPFYNQFARGGEGHLEVAKNVYYTTNHLCHMVLALKPFGCMPSSQSDGVQSGVANHFKEMIFLPIETSGEGEINAHSRVQMALGEAKVKARMEFDQVLQSTGKRLDDIKGYVAEHPELRSVFYPVPHRHGTAGVASNFVLHVNDLMNGKKKLARVPVPAPRKLEAAPAFGD